MSQERFDWLAEIGAEVIATVAERGRALGSITVPVSAQVEYSLLARDAESEQQARRILAAQSSRAERLAIADDVISNDSGLDAAREQVRILHRRYLVIAAGRAD